MKPRQASGAATLLRLVSATQPRSGKIPRSMPACQVGLDPMVTRGAMGDVGLSVNQQTNQQSLSSS